MGSNYAMQQEPETVRVNDLEPRQEVRCSRCRGRGYVLVFDQETDCLECEGYGTVLI